MKFLILIIVSIPFAVIAENIPEPEVRKILERMAKVKIVARQMAQEEIVVHWNAAKKIEASGDFDAAIKAYFRLRELIKKSPSPISFVKIYNIANEKVNTILAEREKAVPKKTDESIAAKKNRTTSRANTTTLLLEAQRAYDAGNFSSCAEICSQIIILDSRHPSAGSLKSLSLRESFQQRVEGVRSRQNTVKSDISIATMVASITPPPGKFMSYPKPEVWRKITERRMKRQNQKKKKPPPQPWEIEIKRNMDKKLSFEFLETPLQDVLEFFSEATSVNIILDRGAVKNTDIPVTLKVSEMKAKSAFQWVLKLNQLDYVIDNEAIFVSIRERLKKIGPDYRVYDLEDLLDQSQGKAASARSWIRFLKQATGKGWVWKKENTDNE